MKCFKVIIGLFALFNASMHAMEGLKNPYPKRVRWRREICFSPVQTCVINSDTVQVPEFYSSADAQDCARAATPTLVQQAADNVRVDREIHEAYLAGIRSLIAHKRVNDSRNGERPLHSAVVRGNLEAVELLLKHGALIDAQTSTGKTALHLACSLGKRACIKILLDAGANVSLKDNEGRAPDYLTVIGSQ